MNEISFAASIHDIGKPYTKNFYDAKGNLTSEAHFYQHQCVGAWMSYGFTTTTPYVAWLISTHMDMFLHTKYYKNLPICLKENLDLFLLLITDIVNSNSQVIALGKNASLVEKAYGVKLENNTALLKGVVSRKKQIVPIMTENA